jgi:phospholipid/cholesterol/gamma-HCH transport system substrate-binding protein
VGQRANQAIIGAFVLGAVLLAVAGVVVLTGDRFFRHTRTFVAYFEGSLGGLDVGAPVTFNGVRIGSVTNLAVVIDPHDASIRTPVVFTIDAARLRDGNGTKLVGGKELPKLDTLIARGLRARLELQSLVTGQLVVALNFYPATPIRLLGLSTHYPEMPTIPSSFDTLTRTLEGLPLETLVAQTTRTMRSVEALATAPEVRSALGKLDRVLSDVDGTVRDVRGRIDPLVTTVQGTAVAAQTTMADVQKTMAEMRSAIAQLTPPAGAAIADYQALAQDGRKLVAHLDAQVDALSGSLQAALADAHGVLGEDSPVRYDLTNALQEMTKAARSLRVLADELDRHPEALLRGKRPETAQ